MTDSADDDSGPYRVDLEIPPEPSPETETAAFEQHTEAARDAFTAQHQTNHNYHFPTAEAARDMISSLTAGIRRLTLDRATIEETLRTVVPVPGVEDALGKLTRARGLVLHGPAESGLKTTAVYLAELLATELRQPDRLLVEVIPDKNVSLDGLIEESQTRVTFLYDLTRADPAETKDALDDMLGLEEKLKDRSGHVLILARPEHVEEFAADRPDHSFAVAKPNPFEVLRSHLGQDVPGEALSVVEQDPELRHIIAESLPARAARIARIVNLAHRAGSTAPADLLTAVRGAFFDWRVQLREEADKGDGRRRSLLLAAALLEQSDAGLVVKAADRLMAFNRLDWTPHNPLAAPSVVSQLDALKELHFDAQDVTFTWPEFGRSVLRYTWQEHPDLRPGIRAWLDWLPSERSVATDDLARVVDRVAMLADDTEDSWLPLGVAQRWVSPSGKNAGDAGRTLHTPGQIFRRSAAVRLLTAAAIQPNTGRAVRAQLYEWAYRRKGDPGVQLTIAEVCGGEFGAVFPANALTRLKHLAANENPVVRRAVVPAAVSVARRIGLGRALDHLEGWLADPQAVREEATTAILAGMLAEPAIVGPSMRTPSRAALVAFWRKCFALLGADELAALLRDWVHAAARAEVHAGSRMVEAMVDAVRGEVREVSLLWWIARKVSADIGSPRSEELFALLFTRLDELDPLTMKHERRKEAGDGR